MSIALFKNIWNIINGRPPIEGIEVIWETVRDHIIGMLNNHSLYDCLDFWSDNELFMDSFDEFKDYLIKQVLTQEVEAGSFVQRLNDSGIKLLREDPPVTATEITLPDKSHVWFSLRKAKLVSTKLSLSFNGATKTLDPSERYTIGRETKSGNKSQMITIQDATESISRVQAELYFRNGKWYCVHKSDNCKTFIQHRGENRVADTRPVILTDNYPYENKIEFYNPCTRVSIVVYYDFVIKTTNND